MQLDFKVRPKVKRNDLVEYEGKKYLVTAIVDLKFFGAGSGFRVFLTKE